MTDVSCPVCKCKDWDHGIECIVTRLVRVLETQRMRGEEVYLFDEAFMKACGIVAHRGERGASVCELNEAA